MALQGDCLTNETLDQTFKILTSDSWLLEVQDTKTMTVKCIHSEILLLFLLFARIQKRGQVVLVANVPPPNRTSHNIKTLYDCMTHGHLQTLIDR